MDLISRQEAIDSLAEWHDEAITNRLNNLAPVDAVPVVRCKDCLHNRACEIQYHAQAGDLFFCGAAERKDGEGRE